MFGYISHYKAVEIAQIYGGILSLDRELGHLSEEELRSQRTRITLFELLKDALKRFEEDTPKEIREILGERKVNAIRNRYSKYLTATS